MPTISGLSKGGPSRAAIAQKRDWAHVVDVNKPMTNFRELVPDMARQVRIASPQMPFYELI